MWPFEKKRRDSIPSKPTVAWDDDFVNIESHDFFGEYSKSENGLYAIAWSDFDSASMTGGNRGKGLGRYFLLRENEILATGSMERPNDGRVANNGNFILNDWMLGEKLQGTFYAFSPEGEQYIGHRFRANLHNNGISPDGLFAVCQLCNSDTSDSGVLVLFDIAKRSLLWKIEPATGWADSYGFQTEKGILILNYDNLGSFLYSFNGEFTDSLRWERARIERADGYTVASIARDKLAGLRENPSDEQVKAILDILDIALARTEKFPGEKAFAYKVQGELYEIAGDSKSAIDCYQKALELNPQAGVKRRLTVLKKSES